MAAGASDRRTLSTFRGHLIATSLLATLVFGVVMALAVFVPLGAQLGAVPVDSDRAVGLADHFLFLHSAFWPVFLLSLLSCVLAASLLYQRMRSPLVRYSKSFAAIVAGSVPDPIVIRAGDYLTEETDALNAMLRTLKARESARRHAAERLDEVMADLVSQGVDAESLEALREVAKFGFTETLTAEPDGTDDT